MSQEFFVNSIKELLTGKLGYVSQSIYADAKRHKQEDWKEYEKAPILSKVSANLLSIRCFIISPLGVQSSRHVNKYSKRICYSEHTEI